MEIQLAVARNLRAIREGRRLSLDAVSRETGVSKSMLGQIERGEVNPTISVVWKIADGLRVSFSSLVEPPEEGILLRRAEDSRPFIEDEGSFRNDLVFTFDAARGYEQYRIALAPGGHLEAKAHMAGAEESLLVFAGELVVTVDGQVFSLKKGDALRFRADVAHGYANPGPEAAEISMILWYEKGR